MLVSTICRALSRQYNITKLVRAYIHLRVQQVKTIRRWCYSSMFQKVRHCGTFGTFDTTDSIETFEPGCMSPII
jgi:hypothetical protein